MSRLPNPQSHPDRPKFIVTLAWGGQTLTTPALTDSGVDESFIDHHYAQRVGLPMTPLEKSPSAFALDRHPMGPITHWCETLTLTVSGNHVESICPYIITSPDTPLVLGRPWLELHTPHVGNWPHSQLERSLPRPLPSFGLDTFPGGPFQPCSP